MTYFKTFQPARSQSLSTLQEEAIVLDKLYNEFAPILYGLMLRILKDEVMAEETLFDCFTALRASKPKNNVAKEEISRSLLVLARSLALEKVQTKQYRYQLLAKELYKCRIYLNVNTQQNSSPNGKEEVNVLLPDKQKIILDKVYFEGKSIPEVALQLGMTDEQVKNLLQQAVITLKSITKKQNLL